MKRILACLILFSLLGGVCLAEAPEAADPVRVTLTVGDLIIPAVLRDNEAAQDFLSKLPMTVTVSRGGVDFCGDIGEPLNYADSDFQDGFAYGDFMWMPDGNWFVFFTDEIEEYSHRHPWLVLGHMDEEWEALKEMRGTIEIEIARADRPVQENQILVQVGDQVKTATLADNDSAAAFKALLAQGPVTLSLHEYGGFEKVGPLGTALVTNDKHVNTVPGDIMLYQGNQVTVFYRANSWSYSALAHIDGADEENMREFLGNGNPEVTFKLLSFDGGI